MPELQSLKSPWALLLIGFILILGSPLVVMTPFFMAPDGCPPCPNFPSITYPLLWPGVVVGILGVVLTALGGQRLKHVPHNPLRTWPLAYVAAALVLVGIVMMTIPISGNGWEIFLYGAEGLYLLLLGFSVTLFVVFSVWIDWRNAIVLSIGLLVIGFLSYNILVDFGWVSRTCSVDGCDAVQESLNMLWLGLGLAAGTFLVGFGIASSLKHKIR